MARTAAIGEQDFSKIIENRYLYVDKTHFIKEWWENGDTVTLITRPRRFGKTLAMHMVYCFFSMNYEKRSDLFENLNIWREDRYRKLQGTYPVIFLSFANVKPDTYQEAYDSICKIIAREYRHHVSIMESSCFLQTDREQFYKILNGNASISDICASLNLLSEYLYDYYGKRAIILLDEYDTPMQEAYANGCWNELAAFMRKLMNAAFKTNPYLERGIMTGITRISRESIFSDLNNLAVITAASRLYETSFGFTENEVFQLLKEFDMQNRMDDVKRWYDGFHFGTCSHIYNPWSVVNFLKLKELKPYWANTSSNRLAGKLIQEGSPEIKIAAEDLLSGKTICASIDEQIIFEQLRSDDNAVWSFLLASGYLKITGCKTDNTFSTWETEYELALTNREIQLAFRKIIGSWFSDKKYGYNRFIKALLANDLKSMNIYMNRTALSVISFFDSGNHPSAQTEPERFYHGLVLGLMVDLSSQYSITSNRESGFGRYDVMMEPHRHSDDGIIFEFKVFDPEDEKTLHDTAKSAIFQILDKKYASVLESKCSRIRIYGFAFRGKEVWIDGGYMEEFAAS